MIAHAGRRAPARRERTSGERRADRAARHAFRSRRVPVGTVAALLLTAAAVIGAIDVIAAMTGASLHVFAYRELIDVRWDGWVTRGICIGLGLVGLVFLLAGLLPGRSRIVPLHGAVPEVVMGVSRRGLRSAVAAAAADAAGVSRVRRVRLRRTRVMVVAETPVHDAQGLDEGVAEAVRECLERIRPLPARAVTVRMKHKEG
ncbi:DUF6286 domain-containing protein [Actinomadura opuntiae]|uniref:DUF6286 domain-containing protein n=1 Tax=Actinomadura sp. OS1-43 TaxID=604315 RepID=UPI00255A76AD|nr:DUF6286 domain-containing protein [Actinomadura sp. OS1-43]MDL4821960.1 DUF6286 domain-containing protein [Actinomadura sp. OS1-43]